MARVVCGFHVKLTTEDLGFFRFLFFPDDYRFARIVAAEFTGTMGNPRFGAVTAN